MDLKKTLIGTVGITVIGASISGIKGLEKGLDLGAKMGFCAGMTMGVFSTAAFVIGKNRIQRKCT
jgi:hypothetical protein